MLSRSLLRRSSKSEVLRLVLWKAFGRSAVRVFRRPPLKQAPGVSAIQAIFLCGLHRSGTSVLHRILRKKDDVQGFENTGVPEDEGQHLQTVFATARQLGGPGVFAFDPRAHLTETDAENLDEAARNRLLREWGAYIDMSGSAFVEKSPPNLIRARFFQSVFPASQFVSITRHPLPVAMATAQKWKIDLEKAVDHWVRAHEIYLEDVAHLKSVHALSYEGLCADPEAEIERLDGFLELGLDGPHEELRNVNGEYFDRWSEMSEDERSSIEAKLNGQHAHVLTALGYADWDNFAAHSGARR